MVKPPEREASTRDTDIMAELRDLTVNLRGALDRFRLDVRLTDLAEKEIPDARQRLSHVVKLTDGAAHRTLDLVERSGPLAERTAREATWLGEAWTHFRARTIATDEFNELVKRMDTFLPAARADSDTVRANLAEVLLAQGYQDLTGQIIRSVSHLVEEVEKTLNDLARLARGEAASAQSADPARSPSNSGPVVPGVSGDATVSDQSDVDALLSDLGM
jgi:chemotaxis protein CheZ